MISPCLAVSRRASPRLALSRLLPPPPTYAYFLILPLTSSHPQVRDEVRRLLKESGAAVVDVLRRFDLDADRSMQVDAMEFNRVMRLHFGFQGRLDVIDELCVHLPCYCLCVSLVIACATLWLPRTPRCHR